MSREFRFTREGNRKAVLLLHGLTGSPSELVYFARVLHKAGFDVHAPILPGHSAGIVEVKSYIWQDWFKASLAEFDQLSPRYDDVFLAGLCVGGTLAMAVGEQRPKARAIAALAPLLRMDGWSIPWTAIFMPLVLYTPLKYFFIFLEEGSLGVKNEQARQMMKAAFAKGDDSLDCFPLICILEMNRFSKYLHRRLKNLMVPTVLFHSEEDDFAHIRNAELVYSEIGSPLKKLHRLHNSYHLIAIDNEKEFVAKETVDFFRRFERSGHFATGKHL